jgi:hypothetical protein
MGVQAGEEELAEDMARATAAARAAARAVARAAARAAARAEAVTAVVTEVAEVAALTEVAMGVLTGEEELVRHRWRRQRRRPEKITKAEKIAAIVTAARAEETAAVPTLTAVVQ